MATDPRSPQLWDGTQSSFRSMSRPESGEHSSDEDFSPGQLIIDTADSSFERSKSSTPTTPGKSTPSAVKREQRLGENDFKGLTFVGKMNVLEPPDTICLYSYHWGGTHIDLITRNHDDTVVPMKNMYGRIVPGLTRNAVSNRIPKIGAKTIALSEGYINVLKKLQLPITARSHYLLITDFIKLCIYYNQQPPSNLASFARITSHSNPVDILKVFNSQVVPTQTPPAAMVASVVPVLAPSHPSSDSDFGTLSPEKLNASLAMTMRSDQYNSQQSLMRHYQNQTDTDRVRMLHFSDRSSLSIVQQEGSYYILNTELQGILPQANPNVIGPLRSLLNIPLEYASRSAMNALKTVGTIGVKACRVIVYKTADVVKMHMHWNLPVPIYLIDLSNGKFPEGVIDKSQLSRGAGSLSTAVVSSLFPKVPSNPSTSAANDQLMSPTGTKVDLGIVKKERKNSHSSQSPLSDQYLEYNYLPWSEGKTITLLTPPTGEPHVAIAELVDKVFSQRSQVSLQRRTRLGVSTLPATSLQIHALRARGSIDPSSGYSKLIPLSGVVRLAKEAAIFVPPNVLEECYKYVSPVELMESLASPVKTTPPRPSSSSPVKMADALPAAENPLFGSPLSIRSDVASHPDVIVPTKLCRTAEGVLFQVNWGKTRIAVFTSARNISYVGLYQIYDVLFKHLVTRMNFKMRMRKLGFKSIRAPSFIRQGLIKLGALPNSSPVCGLLRISEMERLVKSYDINPPQVFYDLFLNNSLAQESSGPDVFKDFTNTDEKFVVSVPRDLVKVSKFPSTTSLDPVTSPPPSSSFSSKTSVLQNLAKKISQKNHRLAGTSSISGGSRKCYSCGRSYPLAKKRCEACGIFLVGHPCPMCSAINYSLCTKCVQCGAILSRGRLSQSSSSAAVAATTSSKSNFSDVHVAKREYVPQEDHTPHSDSSDESHSPTSTVFVAPPIRTAALKSMFPDQASGRSESGAAVVTKTIYSGNLTSSRNCQECGALNTRKAKKCQQCRAPVQGRPCPQCSRPNHSHSTECFKCGAALPPTATKWILGGRILRTTNDSSRLGMTSKQFKKAVGDRAAISCIRCHRIRQYGCFKCGRCGDLYSTKPVYDISGSTAVSSTRPKLQPQQETDSETDLLQFAQNLMLVGVGDELLPTLSEKEEELRQLLYPAEEELDAAEDEYHKLLTEKTSIESSEQTLQGELNVLILEIEKLKEQLDSIKEKEIEASHVMEVCPDQLKELEGKLNAYIDLYDYS